MTGRSLRVLAIFALSAVSAGTFGGVLSLHRRIFAATPPQFAAPPPPPPPSRGTQTQAVGEAQQALLGTGTITGVVKSIATGLPLRGARVMLNGTAAAVTPAGAGAPGSVRPYTPPSGQVVVQAGRSGVAVSNGQDADGPRTVSIASFTDSAGRFSFASLPAGRYLLEAAHEGFLPANYGQKKPGKSGVPIDLTDGQRLELQLPMTRGSAITGTVLDESGDPLVHARVQVLRYIINVNGVKRLRVVSQVQTDDRGVYRFFSLEPADYLVSAMPGSPDGEAVRSGIPDTPGFETGFTAEPGTPRDPGPRVAAELAADIQTDAADDLAPTYYPMSATGAGAQMVAVDGIVERADVNIRVLPIRNGTIRGTILGMPPSLPVQVLLHNPDGNEPLTALTAMVGASGDFALRNIAPGQYHVYAQTLPQTQAMQPQTTVVNGRAMITVAPSVRTTSFDRLHGRTEVIVDGKDTPPISIVLRPGRSISGRVALDFAQPPTGAAARTPTTISIQPAPQAGGYPAFNTSPTVQVDPDGTFTLPGIRPGRYFLRASGPGTVRSVMWSGLDTLDFPLEVDTEHDVANVVITLTDKLSELSGTVTDSVGKAGYDFTVIAMPVDNRLWIPGSRRVRAARANAEGQYTFRGLPPGEYRLAPMIDFDPATQYDFPQLQQLSRSGVPVTIVGAGKTVQNLRGTR